MFQKLSEKNKEVKVVYDFHKVDFASILNKAKIEVSKKALTSSIVEGSVRDINNLISEETKNLPTLTDKNIQKKFDRKIAALKKDGKTKDILSLSIIDFVSKNKSNGTMSCLGKDMTYFENIYAYTLKKDKKMGDIFLEYFNINPNFDLKKNLKEAKKKKIRKMLKTY